MLQALALGGGRYRTAEPGGKDLLTLSGDLEIMRADKLRLIGRIARLEAEFTGAEEITYPAELTASPNQSLVEEIVDLEKLVFAARVNETGRQLVTLSELRDLYDQELDTLKSRAAAGDHSIVLAEKQLAGVTELYNKGISTLSRQADLERVVADLQVERLVDDTEMMKVRQSMSENRRNELSVEDQRRTELAIELRDARAELDRLRSRQITVESLLMQASVVATSVEMGDEAALVFEIVLNENGEIVPRVASESTFLVPGDVLKVDPAGRPGHTTPGTIMSGDTPPGQALEHTVPLPTAKPPQAGDS